MSYLSKSGEYGLRAMIYLSTYRSESAYIPIQRIADDLQISFHFLTKILQILSNRQMIQSYRGPNGGVTLARTPDTITLWEIVETLEGADFMNECLLGLPGCGESTPCPFHEFWDQTKVNLRGYLQNHTLLNIQEETKNQGLHISPSGI